MNLLDRLEVWKQQGQISPEQQTRFAGLVREEPFSLSLEVNILLYAGVIAFVAGLGWTISTWSQQLGAVAIVLVLSLLLAASFGYCFRRVPAWSPSQTSSPTPLFDYVLYFGCLVWCAELAYVEGRFHVLAGQWDIYLLATALLFFLLAYRFDNRLVLSLALLSLAGWFGFTISRWPSLQDANLRRYALLYCLVVGLGGLLLRQLRIKPHFFATYINLAANVLFWTILSGIFEHDGHSVWEMLLVLACVASLSWGLQRREFAFVAYAAVYGYIGISAMVLRNVHDETLMVLYFMVTAVAMIFGLVLLARDFGGTT